jgi:hypothetical protein
MIYGLHMRKRSKNVAYMPNFGYRELLAMKKLLLDYVFRLLFG